MDLKSFKNSNSLYMGPPKGSSKSRFHPGFSHKSRQEITWNSCSRQVYPITLNTVLIFHAITPIFISNSRFHVLKYVQSRHHAFPLGGPPTYYILKLSSIALPLYKLTAMPSSILFDFSWVLKNQV